MKLDENYLQIALYIVTDELVVLCCFLCVPVNA